MNELAGDATGSAFPLGAQRVGNPGQVTVFVLDGNGPNTLEPYGWRGTVFSMASRGLAASAVARELSEQLRTPLEVQTVLSKNADVWIVLRHSGRYSMPDGVL